MKIIKVILYVSILLLTNNLYSQVIPFNIGPVMGWNKSDINFTDVSKNFTKSHTGYKIGLFLRAGNKLYIQPEGYFTSKGGSFNYDVESGSITKKIRINTIDIAALAGYKIINVPMFNMRLMGGPVRSSLINKNISYDSQISSELNKDDFQNAFWTVQLGAGIDVFKITFDVRYEMPINYFAKNSIEGKIRSNLWMFSIGWKFL